MSLNSRKEVSILLLANKTNTLDSLYNSILSHKLILVEGFEFTGKSTLIDKLNEYSQGKVKIWKPDYHSGSSVTGNVAYEDRHLFSVALFDLLASKVIDFKEPIIMDRSMISGFVYDQLYAQPRTRVANMNWLRRNYPRIFKELDIYVVYLNHLLYAEARKMYNTCSVSESYDQFVDFDEYWQWYQAADKLFMKYINPINHTVVNALQLK